MRKTRDDHSTDLFIYVYQKVFNNKDLNLTKDYIKKNHICDNVYVTWCYHTYLTINDKYTL